MGRNASIVALLMTIIMVGCNSRSQPAEPVTGPSGAPFPNSIAAPPASSVPDQWLGKWIGPEGTFLVLAKNGDKLCRRNPLARRSSHLRRYR